MASANAAGMAVAARRPRRHRAICQRLHGRAADGAAFRRVPVSAGAAANRSDIGSPAQILSLTPLELSFEDEGYKVACPPGPDRRHPHPAAEFGRRLLGQLRRAVAGHEDRGNHPSGLDRQSRPLRPNPLLPRRERETERQLTVGGGCHGRLETAGTGLQSAPTSARSRKGRARRRPCTSPGTG
jgi:hypothetical protein